MKFCTWPWDFGWGREELLHLSLPMQPCAHQPLGHRPDRTQLSQALPPSPEMSCRPQFGLKEP
eukprot:87198-Pelagomonas_calceolata.AAC.1